MSDKDKRTKERKRTFRDLRKRYRLVLINDQTFQERLSINLTPLNLLAMVASTFLVISGITIAVVYLTPVSETVPGHTDEESWRNTLYAAAKADSLEEQLRIYEQYVDHTRNILKGNVVHAQQSGDTNAIDEVDAEDLRPSGEDSIFRENFGKAEAYNIYQDNGANGNVRELSSIFFFTPLRGAISSEFDPMKKHLGVDVVAPKDEAIKATLDGTVIMAAWTSSAGHVIQLQHENNLISVYKHNSVLLKKEGEKVQAGEAIAIIGDTGELTDGPHLHFELWHQGEAIDPQEYMVFD